MLTVPQAACLKKTMLISLQVAYVIGSGVFRTGQKGCDTYTYDSYIVRTELNVTKNDYKVKIIFFVIIG